MTAVATVDVRDMLVVHQALLRELRLAPAAVERTDPGDQRRVRRVADHLGFVGRLLHHHHDGEDRLLWPLLVSRLGPRDCELVAAVEEQHAGLDLELTGVGSLRRAWRDDPTPSTRHQLTLHLGHLHELLAEHLELEERALLPLAATHLTAAEWHAVGEAAIESMPKPELALSFGMFSYEGDPEVLADMLRPAPWPVRRLLPPIARAVHARRARRVHGTSTP